MTTSPESFGRNMTEVLFPSQPFDTRAAEYNLASAEWFSPNNFTLGNRLQGVDSTKHSAPAFPHTPPPSSTSPQSRSDPFSNPQLPQTNFKGLEDHMSQGNNPFASISSNSIPQPILPSSNPNRPSTSSQPQQQQQQQGQQQEPPTPRSFQTIAPDPVGLREIQRQHQEHEETSKARPLKRPFHQTSMDAPAPPALKDEDKLLLQLKDEQQLPWKNIVARFQQETGKVHAIAALQMRYKRLKDRLQVWTDPDVEALKQAHDYWESRKFDIISAKMLEFGATEKFSALACRRKWQELNPNPEYGVHTIPMMGNMPHTGFSQSSSPQPIPHSGAAYTPTHPNSSYHLPQPAPISYGSLQQSTVPSQSSYPTHTQGYGQATYTSYAPVTQSQPQQPATYRQSPTQAGAPHPSQQTGYTSQSPRQQFSSYPPSTGQQGGQQPPGAGQGGYWH